MVVLHGQQSPSCGVHMLVCTPLNSLDGDRCAGPLRGVCLLESVLDTKRAHWRFLAHSLLKCCYHDSSAHRSTTPRLAPQMPGRWRACCKFPWMGRLYSSSPRRCQCGGFVVQWTEYQDNGCSRLRVRVNGWRCLTRTFLTPGRNVTR